MFNLHDNEILSYEVNLRNKNIIISTNYYGTKTANIYFNEVLAHNFENEISYSTICELGEYSSINSFIRDYSDLLERGKSQSWPMDYKTFDELEEKLIKGLYKCYFISSSYGLSGWILAKSVEVQYMDE